MKEPALSDGRLQPGDKLLAANGVELASFSHQEVIILMVLLMMVIMMVITIGDVDNDNTEVVDDASGRNCL